MPESEPITEAKTVLRRRMRSQRRMLAQTAPQAGVEAARLAPDRLLANAKIVGGYDAQGSEIGAGPLLARLAGLGKTLALPVVTMIDGPLTFRRWSPGDPMVPDLLDIASPGPDAEALEPDLLIVPLLAFDRRGGRLGQGGGHFDRTLAALDAGGGVFALGLAFAGQEVAEAPMAEHDRRLDAILTEKEYIPVRKDV